MFLEVVESLKSQFLLNHEKLHPVLWDQDLRNSTADTCKNCAKCDKGFKIGTNEAYNISSKLGLGAFRKFSAFVLTPIWLPQTKEKFLKKFLLNFTN